jgi:hypothetical protein
MAGARAIATIALFLPATLAGAAPAATVQAHWRPLIHLHGVVDVVGLRADGRFVVSTRGGLFLMRANGTTEPFANGAGGYTAATSGEAYAALAPARRLASAHCSFHRDDIYVLAPGSSPAIERVTAAGKAVHFSDLPAGAFPSGIAFDTVGNFGYRLLVTATFGSGSSAKTTLFALDCLGHESVLGHDLPHAEGGIAVAPGSFPRFGGELIAADETTGRILAFDARGSARLLSKPTVRAGSDIGMESIGFVPTGLGSQGSALLADLGAPGSPTEGNDQLLVLAGRDLAAAGLRAGELVAATEAGATTVAVDCARTCTARVVAIGPASTHGEGHITFARGS